MYNNINTPSQSSPPAFLEKLYELLSDEANYSEYISWQPDGRSFLIKKATELSEKVLPKFFKHNNLQSFIRQLNMYCFSKTRHDSNYREFTHKLFQRNRKDLLCFIKRKTQKINKNNYIIENDERLPSHLPDSNDLEFINNQIESLSNPIDDHGDESQLVVDLRKRVQSLEMQLWIMSDRYDALSTNHNELCQIVDDLRRGIDNQSITSSNQSNDSDFCRIVSSETIKIKEEPMNLLNGGGGLTRQQSINGYDDIPIDSFSLIIQAANDVSTSIPIKQEICDATSLSAIEGLVQVRRSINSCDNSQIEDGVSTLVRTLSHSMYVPSNPLAGQELKRQKSY